MSLRRWSFDGLNYSRGTNLGLKGIIGLKAMSLISRMLEVHGGSMTDSAYYAVFSFIHSFHDGD